MERHDSLTFKEEDVLHPGLTIKYDLWISSTVTRHLENSQLTFTCSKSTKALEKKVKYVQN